MARTSLAISPKTVLVAVHLAVAKVRKTYGAHKQPHLENVYNSAGDAYANAQAGINNLQPQVSDQRVRPYNQGRWWLRQPDGRRLRLWVAGAGWTQ